MPKHGRENQRKLAEEHMRKAMKDLELEHSADTIQGAIDEMANPMIKSELGVEPGGGSRGVWITPIAKLMGCEIETPPGLSCASTEDQSTVKKKILRFEESSGSSDEESKKSGLCKPMESLTRQLSVMTVKSDPRAQHISAMSAPEWQEIEITVDSGAYDTVMPAAMCGHISICSTPMSRGGMTYEVANGECLPNLGERKCLMMTENSHTMKRITFQCADVHKALLSISRISDLGYECTLGKEGGQLRDTVTDDRVPVHRKGNLYVIRAWVRADDQSFGRQG